MITGGIAPQVSELFDGGTEVDAFDGTVKLWLDSYREWGHMTEGGTATLRYDTQCCHTQGECEWQVCADTILTRLVGGTAAAGVYVGSEDHVAVPVVHHVVHHAGPTPTPTPTSPAAASVAITHTPSSLCVSKKWGTSSFSRVGGAPGTRVAVARWCRAKMILRHIPNRAD